MIVGRVSARRGAFRKTVFPFQDRCPIPGRQPIPPAWNGNCPNAYWVSKGRNPLAAGGIPSAARA